MRKEFGPGAEGAARTFQGVINRMQNSFALLYESFEPVAVGFLNSVVMPMTSGLKAVTDGFNVFFAGQAAQTASGSAFAKQLEALRPTFEGIAANIKQILPLLQSFANTALSLGQVLLQIAGNPFVGYLARIYLSVLPLTMALRVLNLQALIPLIASFLRAIPAFVAFNTAMISGTSANKGLQLAMQLTGQTASVTAGKIRLVGAALATLGTATILLGIGLLIERFMMMKGAIDGVRQSTQQMLGSISGMANSGAVKELQNVSKNIQKQKATFSELKDFVSGGVLGGGKKELTQEMADKFKEVGMGSFVSKSVFGKPIITDFLRATEIIEARLKGLNKESSSVTEKLPMAQRIAADIAKQAKDAENAASSQGVTGEDDADKKKTSLESYYSLQDQLAKNFTQAEIDRLEAEHQHKIDLIKSEYDLKEARANSFQKEALKFERRMAEITLERQGALLKASNAVMAAQGSVAGGAVGGLPTTGATGLLQGSTGVSSGAHFDIRRADGSFISPEQARALLDPAVRRQVTTTSAYGPRRAPVPGASTFHKGVDLAGPANTPLNLAPGYSMVGQGEEGGLGYAASVRGPQGEMYKVGHLQRPAAGAGAARKVPGSEKRDIVADQKTQLEQVKQSATARQAEAKAIKDAELALADFVANVTPVEEQKLQNDLLKRRTELMMQGYSESAVDQALKFAEAEYKVNEGTEANKRLVDAKIISQAQADKNTKIMTKSLNDYSIALEENSVRLRDNRLAQAMTVLQDRMSMARALTPDQELQEQIRQRDPSLSPEMQEGLFQQEKLVQGAEKLKANLQGIAGTIGDSFGEAFKGIVTGSMTAQEALAGFFQSVADYFMDMVAQMIAEYLKLQLIKGLASLFGGIAGGLGGGGANLGSNSSAVFGLNSPDMMQYSPLGFANGGIAAGGFQAFANGGIVTGPTLGLVGEGRYNEAVIPLPDGKSVPVKLSGGTGNGDSPSGRMQSAMARYGANARGESAQASNGNESDGGTLAPGGLATIDVRYSVERINDVE
jgi:murein DD-endopeptidase MepM/ murein hydrolase activator NlpD